MASTIVLKRRISSIKNTRQITKAMQLVSASKLRRAQEYAMRSRDYYDLAVSLITKLSTVKEVENQPLFAKREVKNKLYVVVTSNSGLAGAYNANTLKLLTKELKQDLANKIGSKVISVGNKGAQFVRRIDATELIAVYPSFGDHPTANDIRPVLNTVIEKYKNAEVDEVKIIYTIFKSTISQTAAAKQLLPAVKLDDLAIDPNVTTDFIPTFEPDIETVIDEVTTRLIEAEIWQSVLESLASEHAMRMVAMKNATDNAKDLIDDYTLELNTARQAGITQELAEISGGVEALKT